METGECEVEDTTNNNESEQLGSAEVTHNSLNNDNNDEVQVETDQTVVVVGDVDLAVDEVEPADELINYYWDYKDLAITKTKTCDKEPIRDSAALASSSAEEFSNQNILKGCKWAPDGSCILTNSDDNILRIFNLPTPLCNIQDWNTLENADNEPETVSVNLLELELEPSLKIKEGGSVYDYCWYPHMTSMDPATSCFLASAGDNPIHLFDAFDGKLRATYLTFNHLEQIISPHAVSFDLTGNKIYSGFKNSIKIFDTSRPGKHCVERKLKTSVLPDLNQHGIISCFAFNPTCSTIYACGSFQRSIGLYLEDGTVMAMLEGHLGGVTHLKFSHDGTKLFSGGRKDSRLICWDIRNLGEEYQILNREVETNQRIYFDITRNDRYLVSGETSGLVSIWDLYTSIESTDFPGGTWKQTQFRASKDCVNGISINPFTPILATTSGQRHFCDIAEDSSDDEMFIKSPKSKEHALKLWRFL